MPATTLDPVTALDLRKGIVSRPIAHPVQASAHRAAPLALLGRGAAAQ